MSSTRLLAIHFVQHPVGKVAPGLEEKEPSWYLSEQVKVCDGEQCNQWHDSMDESNECQSVWRDPVGQVADQFGGHRIVEPFVQETLVTATVLMPL